MNKTLVTTMSQPNILVFMTDDHGPWATHSYGVDELRTPNLDWLGDTGSRFTNAHTPGPVCSPSRACFFTGRFPSQHGIHDWLDGEQGSEWMRDETNLAERLKAVGYQTGLVGKWHCGDDANPQPGFDFWCSHAEGIFPFEGTCQWGKNGKRIASEGNQADFITGQAVEFLRERKKNQPFFLFAGYADTHSPFTDHPPELVDYYRKHCRLDERFEENASRNEGWIRFGNPSSREERIEWLAQYYAAVEMIDRQVGRLIEELKATGELENTLIVYTSDHGHMNGQHGLYTKTNATVPACFYNESIQVPLLVRSPGSQASKQICDAFVDHCDLHQTLLEAALGQEAAESIGRKIQSPGKSYLSYLGEGVLNNPRQFQCCEFGNSRMIRSSQYKLIQHYPIQGQSYSPEFYDLLKDPRETCNVFNNPAYKDTINQMTRQLQYFFSTHETAGKSGLQILDQPVHNPWEIWCMQEPETWDSEGSDMRYLRAYVKSSKTD